MKHLHRFAVTITAAASLSACGASQRSISLKDLLVDRAGNTIVVESVADRIDVFPPGARTPSVTVTISGIGNLAELAMRNN